MRNPTPNSSPVTSERRIVLFLAGLSLLLASLPVLFGYAIYGRNFIGSGTNIDDFCIYLAWLQQTSHDHIFIRNLYTTEPQLGKQFYLFFSLLGLIVRVTNLPEAVVLQLSKFTCGLGLLFLIYRFYKFCVPTEHYARINAFAFACLSSGFGWIFVKNPFGPVIDDWQPEAYTFLSLEASALFCVSTLLILATVYALLLGERTGQWRYSIMAGFCAALLGNFHSYDIIHVAGAWGLFLIVWTVIKRGRGVGPSWGRAILAFFISLPTTLYVYYIYKADPVFRQRADIATHSPVIWDYVLGYGLVFLLATFTLVIFVRRQTYHPREENVTFFRPFADFQTAILCCCWAIAGLAIIYVPVPFQRKMLMGEHIPLCLLAGVGLMMATNKMPARVRTIVSVIAVLITIPSNLLFVGRDLANLRENRGGTVQRPALVNTMLDAFDWIRTNAVPNSAIVGDPFDSLYIPSETGHAVWAGHWAETPDFEHKFRQYTHFADRQTTTADRQAFLASTGAQYLFYPTNVALPQFTDDHGTVHYFADLAHQTPAYLTPVYANEDYTIFLIKNQ